MTGLDHEHSAQIDVAGEWLAQHAPGSIRPVVPTLRDRFGLAPMEAIAAIRVAEEIRRAAYACPAR